MFGVNQKFASFLWFADRKIQNNCKLLLNKIIYLFLNFERTLKYKNTVPIFDEPQEEMCPNSDWQFL